MAVVLDRVGNCNNNYKYNHHKFKNQQPKVCNYWVQGNCKFGDRCKFLHSWNIGDSYSLLTSLEGHKQVVTGIVLPSGKDKLYTGGKDGDVRVWDCNSGQCVNVIPLGGEIGCMISAGSWIFIGLPNLVKAWNIDTVTEMNLDGPVGQVYALVVANDQLFAGTHNGSIMAWKFNQTANCFALSTSLLGHSRAVITMVVGANSRLYSGSMDNTIRVWNLETLQCVQTLTEHTSVVMSVLSCGEFLFSASLDKTMKVWATNISSGNLELTYTHDDDAGILALCGMTVVSGSNGEAKPVILSSSNDNCTRFYDLPSFKETGKIFSKHEIRTIQVGPTGVFFTGDGNGQVRVWRR